MKNYDDLVKKYPELFGVEEDSQEPFAHFGFECGIGWYDIIDKACQIIYSEYKHHLYMQKMYKRDLDDIEKTIQKRQSWDKDKTREWIIAHTEASYSSYSKMAEEEKERLPKTAQIKEKFGTLRWYVNNADKTSQKIIDFAELMSENTCEVCGEYGKTYTTGWHKTFCLKHAIEKYGKEKVDQYNS
jgi:hypothetical protein